MSAPQENFAFVILSQTVNFEQKFKIYILKQNTCFSLKKSVFVISVILNQLFSQLFIMWCFSQLFILMFHADSAQKNCKLSATSRTIAQSVLILEVWQPFTQLPRQLWTGQETLRSNCSHSIAFTVPLSPGRRRSSSTKINVETLEFPLRGEFHFPTSYSFGFLMKS